MTTDGAKMEGGATPSMSLAEAAQLRVIDARKVRFSKAGARLDFDHIWSLLRA